jgi:hypothetical protein
MSSFFHPHHPKREKKRKNRRHPQIYHFFHNLPQTTPTGFISTLHDTPHTTHPPPFIYMTIFNQHPSSPNPTMSKPTTPVPKPASPTNLPVSPLKAGCTLPAPPSALSPAASMTSLATRTITLKMSAFSTLAPSQLLLSPPPLTMAHTPLEALNSTTKQDTIAKCPKGSTHPSA